MGLGLRDIGPTRQNQKDKNMENGTETGVM